MTKVVAVAVVGDCVVDVAVVVVVVCVEADVMALKRRRHLECELLREIYLVMVVVEDAYSK